MWHGCTNSIGEDDLRVLIVEDEEFARSALSVLLTAKGYHTSQAGSAEQALDTLEAGCRPEIALVDFDLPGMNGADSFPDWFVFVPTCSRS